MFLTVYNVKKQRTRLEVFTQLITARVPRLEVFTQLITARVPRLEVLTQLITPRVPLHALQVDASQLDGEGDAILVQHTPTNMAVRVL